LTLSSAATKLAEKVHDTSSAFVTKCKQWLQDSRYLILNEANEWSFLETEGNVTTVVGRSSYSFVTDFGSSTLRKITSLKTSEGRLIKLKPVEVLDSKLTGSTGSPLLGAVWGGTLRLWPTPSAIEQLSYKGYNRAVDLTDSESPQWEGSFDIIWRLGAEAMALEFLDDGRSAQKWAVFNRALKTMFGDNAIEDEEITMENFSTSDADQFFLDDAGAPWP
jgi:hypothetical protein